MNDKQDDFSFVKLIDQMKIKSHVPAASSNIETTKKLKFEPNKNIVRQHGTISL
jgi:hypothetical protein